MSASKQRGTAWETAIVNYLHYRWPNVERRALRGGNDQGDIAGIPGVVIEAKSYTKAWRLAEWWKETEREIGNGNARTGALWIKRTGKTDPARGWVIMDGETYVRLLKDAGW
jgi:hypothetical protein